MAGKDIRLGELLKVIPFVREIHLLFYDGNDEGEPHRKAITSSENAENIILTQKWLLSTK